MKIAIFASGSGSNAENIAKYFEGSETEIALILTNKSNAFVLERAKKLEIESVVFDRDQFYQSEEVVNLLQKHNIDLIVLAGFLWLVPNNLIKAFPNQIINIHPALLPNYGGKGMYGNYVHQAVFNNKENETGITIHYVNEAYDEGAIIAQYKTKLDENDTPKTIAEKVHELEYEYFPKEIEKIALEIRSKNR